MRALPVLLLASLAVLVAAAPVSSASGVDRCVGKPSLSQHCVHAGSDGACISNQAGLQGSTTCATNGPDGVCASYDATFQHYGACLPVATALPGTVCTTDFLGLNGGGACVDSANPRNSCFWIDHPVTVGGC